MQKTTNTQAFIDAEVYSAFILRTLHDGLLPTTFYRNVGDFMSGDTLNIKTVGSVTLQETAEDTPITYSPIESGEITFRITEHKGDGWYVTDDLREDGSQVDALMAARSSESTRAIQESFETDFLKVGAEVYAATAGPFNVNGFAHKIVSSETNNIFAIGHLVAMKLAFNKANVPEQGRVFICDSTVEATLDNAATVTHDVTEYGRELLQGSMFSPVTRLMGWDIIQSNRLHVADADDGTTSLSDAVYNMFMCVKDDQCKPIMGAWRRMPKMEGGRNYDYGRDEFVTRARWGFGVQRMDTMGVLCTDPTKYE